MKLLVFGANSQLGRELVRLLADNKVDYATLTGHDVDILKQKDIVRAVSRVNPTQLINVATYTNLEKAESDPVAAKECDLVNTEGVSSLANVCEQLNIPLIHLSSSYVFDGLKKESYSEEDETNPVCRFGLSKWYGERTIREVMEKHVILRTDWLFGRQNTAYFRKHIRDCTEKDGRIRVVDNRFSPTPADDAARVLFAIARQIDCNATAWGTYHYNALQPVNQDQFVEGLLEEAARHDDKLELRLKDLSIELMPVEKPFIRNSSLNCEKLLFTFGIKQRSRAPGLTAVIQQIYKIKPGKQPPTPAPVAQTTPPPAAGKPGKTGVRRKNKAAAKKIRRPRRAAGMADVSKS